MNKNTSFALSEQLQEFVASQVQTGNYSSASEVVRAALRLLEEQATKLEVLRAALRKGEESESIPLADYQERFAARREQYLAERGISE